MKFVCVKLSTTLNRDRFIFNFLTPKYALQWNSSFDMFHNKHSRKMKRKDECAHVPNKSSLLSSKQVLPEVNKLRRCYSRHVRIAEYKLKLIIDWLIPCLSKFVCHFTNIDTVTETRIFQCWGIDSVIRRLHRKQKKLKREFDWLNKQKHSTNCQFVAQLCEHAADRRSHENDFSMCRDVIAIGRDERNKKENL